jgi:hypothetical protein
MAILAKAVENDVLVLWRLCEMWVFVLLVRWASESSHLHLASFDTAYDQETHPA